MVGGGTVRPTQLWPGDPACHCLNSMLTLGVANQRPNTPHTWGIPRGLPAHRVSDFLLNGHGGVSATEQSPSLGLCDLGFWVLNSRLLVRLLTAGSPGPLSMRGMLNPSPQTPLLTGASPQSRHPVICGPGSCPCRGASLLGGGASPINEPKPL